MKCDSDGFFSKIYKNRQAAGASVYKTIDSGHSAQQMGIFSTKNFFIFGSNPLP